MKEQTFDKICRNLAILLTLCFLVSMTTVTVYAKTGDGHDLKSHRLSGDSYLQAVYDGDEVLMYGTTSNSVKTIQKVLIDLGYSIPDGPTTYFGKQTLAAVKEYQKNHGITQTGNVGKVTIKALDDSCLIYLS